MKKFLVTLLLGASFANAATTQELERKINILTKEVQDIQSQGLSSRVSLGGYGEIVFKDNSDSNAQWDTLRNVLYVGYKFSDKWSFMTEIEIEHADEIYTEFAEIRYAHSELLNFKAGLLLSPLGLVNLEHEPTRFIGVNRPEIEKNIIPTTMRENGFGVYGTWKNLDYKYYIMNSLEGWSNADASGFDADGVRDGRQKGAKAVAGHWSHILRLDYGFDFGLDLGTSVYVGTTNGDAQGEHNIYDVHLAYNYKGLMVKALYVYSTLDGKEFSAKSGNVVADVMQGYYVDLGYNITHSKTYTIMPYVRYESYNTQDDVDATVGVADKANDRTNLTAGVMYKPLDKVSFKADYTKYENASNVGESEAFNFGIGWEY
ncbi:MULTISPECIES: hypothetical protein [Halobacteriovorax]|uniref:Porin domain-containing protein n=1 Tax=Halobacteriovorax vibrionivorans TaxID=2152716 RepID=A0ABY0IHE9_9BACT|nr:MULTISPECIES: hypothetical protein [Halobacteriovorax]AYF45292.1 hypothetical protein BALOs_2294 [Halobacteriovorax sp. BALOs_7]RZF22379.1 hypothetical protein DAY19_01005 [Halobacteriovorax vibrionivorans]TGD48631.1 hypothetical protein EP118_03920 [Halobacteriovorax sp. Y22]